MPKQRHLLFLWLAGNNAAPLRESWVVFFLSLPKIHFFFFSLPLKTTCAGITRIAARGRCCISEEHPLAQLVPSFQLQRHLENRFARLRGSDWEMKRWPS